MKIYVTVEINAPDGREMEIKECLAMCLEGFGSCRVLQVQYDKPEQLSIRYLKEAPPW